jgi:long-chain acyl-CoA synthetase
MPATLPDFVFAAARTHPERVALLGERPVTYAELARESVAFARVLGARGARASRVGLLLPNVPEFPAAFFGALHAGASVVMLNPLYSPREVGEYLADSGARLVVTTAALQPLLPADAEAVLVEDVAGQAARRPMVRRGCRRCTRCRRARRSSSTPRR